MKSNPFFYRQIHSIGSHLPFTHLKRNVRRYLIRKYSGQFRDTGKGFSMCVDDMDTMDLLSGNPYEPAVTEFFEANIKNDDIALDLGANDGYYSLLFASKCTQTHSFEPDEYNYRILCKNIKENTQLRGTIIPVSKAVSNKIGKARMHIELDHRGANAITENGDEVIETTTLDAYFNGKKFPTIIKMDVEGHEKFAIEGGMEIFKSARLIVLEARPQEGGRNSAAIKMLESMGFGIHQIDEINFYADRGHG